MWTSMIMDENNSISYLVHHKANAFAQNVEVERSKHEVAKGMHVAFHLQSTMKAIKVWKELPRDEGMKSNTSDGQLRNGCHEIFWSDLPEDVICKVLARLPVPRLVQVGTICKQWHSIIMCSCFQELWEDTFSQETYFPMVLSHRTLELCLAYNHTAKEWQKMPSLSFLPFEVRTPVAGARGILCFRRDTSLFLCNPLTKTVKELPMLARKWLPYTSVHLIVDNRAKSFKVIVVGKLCHDCLIDTNLIGSIAIFESSTGTWRSISNLPPKVFSYGRTSAMCKGVIYCEAICFNGKLGVIGYDAQRGVWNDVIHEVPHDNYGDYQLSDIVECGGCIWMVVGRGYGGIVTRIYVLKLELGKKVATTPKQPTLRLMHEDATDSTNNQVEEVRLQSNQCWRRVTDLPSNFLDKLRDVWYGEDESSQLVFVAHISQICIVAGKSLVLMYNIVHDSWSILPSFSLRHQKEIETYGGVEATSIPIELRFNSPF